MKKLDKNVNLYQIVIRTFGAIFIYGGLVGILFINTSTYEYPWIKTVLVVLAAILSLLTFIGHLITPLFIYKVNGYHIHEDHMEVIKGVIFRAKDIIPVKRIQHVEKMQGPIQILFKQASVRVYSAGSIGVISGLSVHDADTLLYEIKSKLDAYLELNEEKAND